jgi:hypothetical protein
MMIGLLQSGTGIGSGMRPPSASSGLALCDALARACECDEPLTGLEELREELGKTAPAPVAAPTTAMLARRCDCLCAEDPLCEPRCDCAEADERDRVPTPAGVVLVDATPLDAALLCTAVDVELCAGVEVEPSEEAPDVCSGAD